MQLFCPQCGIELIDSLIDVFIDGEVYRCPKCGLESELYIDSQCELSDEQTTLLIPLTMNQGSRSLKEHVSDKVKILFGGEAENSWWQGAP